MLVFEPISNPIEVNCPKVDPAAESSSLLNIICILPFLLDPLKGVSSGELELVTPLSKTTSKLPEPFMIALMESF